MLCAVLCCAVTRTRIIDRYHTTAVAHYNNDECTMAVTRMRIIDRYHTTAVAHYNNDECTMFQTCCAADKTFLTKYWHVALPRNPPYFIAFATSTTTAGYTCCVLLWLFVSTSYLCTLVPCATTYCELDTVMIIFFCCLYYSFYVF
jgi:hypothetical protein